MATSGSTFSYAQAAKGKSSTSSTASGSIKLNTEDSESTVKMDSSSEETKDFKQTGGAQPISVDDAAESVSSSQSRSQAKSSETSTEQSISKGSDAAQRKPSTTVSSTAEGVSTMPLNGAETVSHTESGDVTPSAKDEETSAAANDSESTWDKVSQESHSEEKPVNKSEGDGDDSKLDSWEHVAQPAQQAEPAQPIPLKEAPPPSINIWQKRQADFQKNKPSQGDKGHVSSQRGTQDSTDPEKADPRKRLQTERGSREDKMTSSEGKSSEAKGRANEEGRIWARNTLTPCCILLT
jgi:la-related protein 1